MTRAVHGQSKLWDREGQSLLRTEHPLIFRKDSRLTSTALRTE